jgi:tRNA-uridine 2-sulfurtransferase
MKKKVVVAMSGGVDSSVAAALLKQQGYDVIGVFMQFWYPSGESYGENRCCSLESYHEARAVANVLNIPIHKINFGRQFKKLIVDEFLKEHKSGRTPNPCVACNKFIKFDLLLKYAKTVFGADYLATGHYVKLTHNKSGYKLSRPKDKAKDQTYFLYNLKQEQLKHLLFPLAGYQKEQVRDLAKKLKLAVHAKKDSQEICFVGASREDFLKRYLKLKPGKIVDTKGDELGIHRGLPLYTVGQRTGLGLSGGPWYVAQINLKENKLIVTKNAKDKLLGNKEIKCEKISWINSEPQKFPTKCSAQIRYRSKAELCRIEKNGKSFKVIFTKPQHAPAIGQSIVFYEKNQLLGGGVIA